MSARTYTVFRCMITSSYMNIGMPSQKPYEKLAQTDIVVV